MNKFLSIVLLLFIFINTQAQEVSNVRTSIYYEGKSGLVVQTWEYGKLPYFSFQMHSTDKTYKVFFVFTAEEYREFVEFSKDVRESFKRFKEPWVPKALDVTHLEPGTCSGCVVIEKDGESKTEKTKLQIGFFVQAGEPRIVIFNKHSSTLDVGGYIRFYNKGTFEYFLSTITNTIRKGL